MDEHKHTIKKYWNWRSASYGWDADKSGAIARQWQSLVNDLASDVPGKRALDIGTGTGQLAVYLARAGFSVTAIDISEEMIAQAARYALREDLDVEFQTGDAENLPFPDNVFDVVVARNLLWTLPHPDQALLQWRRVLKPGGRLMISDGLWANTTWRRIHRVAVKMVSDFVRDGRSVAFRFFWSYAGLQKRLPYYEGLSQDDAIALLEKAGFSNIVAEPASRFPVHPYGQSAVRRPPEFFVTTAAR